MRGAPVLVLNAGSSSLKFALFSGETRLLSGSVDRIGAGQARARARATGPRGEALADQSLAAADHAQALDWLLPFTARAGGAAPTAVGHRVVHGSDLYTAPVRITPEVLADLESLIPLAPLHEPHNLAPVRVLAEREPSLPQVACFDTAFHATAPRLERLLTLPRAYFEKGVKRYGFHGLSYESVAARLPAIDARAADGRTVVCHLGNGASMCAMKGGRSVATTMGFTALDGLMMGTRTGALDPGAVLYLLETERLGADALRDLLYKRSGLLGVSGESADMRDLLASREPGAAEAVELFCHRAARELASLAVSLSGLDAVVFTGGIGENAAPVRARICEKLAFLGVEVDPAANAERATSIHAETSAVSVLVVPTDEEGTIARHVVATLGLGSGDRLDAGGGGAR